MSRRWLGRAAVRLYPDDIRGDRGEELLGTLLDAGERSRASFIGQLWSLIVAGLLARSRHAWTGPMRRIASDTLRWCALISVTLGPAGMIAGRMHWGAGVGAIPLNADTICPAVILALFVGGRDRAAGLTGVGFLFYLSIAYPLAPTYDGIHDLVILVGFVLMTHAPRRRRDGLRALVLIPLLAQAFVSWNDLASGSQIGSIVPALTAATLVTITPSLTLGTALASSVMAFPYLTDGAAVPTGLELLSCAPVAFVFAALSRHTLRLTRQ